MFYKRPPHPGKLLLQIWGSHKSDENDPKTRKSADQRNYHIPDFPTSLTCKTGRVDGENYKRNSGRIHEPNTVIL